MNVIVFASRKGGSGKSTLAAHLAAQIKATKPILLVDADPQGSLTLWHKLRGTNEPPIKSAVNRADPPRSAGRQRPISGIRPPSAQSRQGRRIDRRHHFGLARSAASDRRPHLHAL